MNTRIRFSALALIASTILFASCQKTEIDPQAPAQQNVVKTDALYDGGNGDGNGNGNENNNRPPVIIK